MTAFFKDFLRKNGMPLGLFLLLSFAFWMLILIFLPQFFMLEQSFHYKLPTAEVGTASDVYTLSQYEYLIYGNNGASGGYNIIDLTVFMRTIIVAVLITILDILICYPIAYIATKILKGMQVRIFMALLIIPYWLNEILRATSFRIIFAESGILNNFLMFSGIINEPIQFIYENYALYAGLGYAYVLMMLFPIYNAIESLDTNQIEAARDLGCPWWRVHWRIVIPHAKPGIVSGAVVVFMLTAGALALPNILGGPNSLWYTQLVYQWFNDGNNWPRGSAYAFSLLIFCVFFVLLMMKLFRVKVAEVAK